MASTTPALSPRLPVTQKYQGMRQHETQESQRRARRAHDSLHGAICWPSHADNPLFAGRARTRAPRNSNGAFTRPNMVTRNAKRLVRLPKLLPDRLPILETEPPVPPPHRCRPIVNSGANAK